jgi:hypothetical protein
VVKTLPRGREADRGAERALGSSAFVAALQRPAFQRARAGIVYLWVEVLGHPGRPVAHALSVSPQAVDQAVARGRETRREWEGLLKR